MPHSATFLRFVPAAALLVLVFGPTATAVQAEKLSSDHAKRWPSPVELWATAVRNEVPTVGGAGCRFGEWRFSGGPMVLWADGAAGDVDFEIAIEPWATAEACGAAHQGSTAVAPGGDEPPLATLDVVARDLWFSPAEMTISGSDRSTIRLKNEGRVVHNLTVDELGVEIVVTRSGTGEAVLTDVGPGTYAFYCSISGHREAGMEGTLTVQ